jgi:hypothetical protein
MKKDPELARLERLALEGIRSGKPVPADAAFFAAVRARLEAKARHFGAAKQPAARKKRRA